MGLDDPRSCHAGGVDDCCARTGELVTCYECRHLGTARTYGGPEAADMPRELGTELAETQGAAAMKFRRTQRVSVFRP